MQDTWSAEKSVLSVLCMMALFITGILAGREVAVFNAPGSFLAEAAGFVAPPLSFIVSLIAWQGLTLLTLIFKMLKRLFKRTEGQSLRDALKAGSDESAEKELRNKAWVMIAVHLAIFLPAGALVGLVAASFPTAMLYFTALGLLYGGALYGLAKADMLPLADEI